MLTSATTAQPSATSATLVFIRVGDAAALEFESRREDVAIEERDRDHRCDQRELRIEQSAVGRRRREQIRGRW